MKRVALIVMLALMAVVWTGCGGASPASNSNSNSQPAVFITGEDAPVSSVVAFNITIDKITLNNSSSTVTALSTPTAVDFGRLVGLRSLLGFNTITPGTYTSASITFETSNPAPSINYINLATTPPSLGTATGSLSTTAATVTVPFPTGAPLTVGTNGLAGLHMDFDLRDSLAFDANGNLIINNNTIVVTPAVSVMAVSASDEEGQITEFTGNVVSVGANSFVMQGPYGFQESIDVNSNTVFNGSNSLGNLQVDAIVSVEGTVQDDGSILANCVEVITTDKAFISGRILAVNPGPVVTMFVGEELGTSATIPVDSVYTVDLSQVPSSKYDICFIDNWFTQELFSPSSLVAGQRIFVGGTYASSAFTPDMVSLRRQGVVGTLVQPSVNIVDGNQGSFQMQNDALMSYSAGGPFTVYTVDKTIFYNIDGLSGLQSAGTANLIARGLVFYDPSTQKPVVWAHRVRVLPLQ